MSKRKSGTKSNSLGGGLLGLLKKYSAQVFWLGFISILAFSIINTFRGLGVAPIMDWDEARHGISAAEMLKKGDYLVQTYMGQVDYWNLKPPLSFLPIIFAYKLFGLSAFSLRFFSALSLVLVTGTSMLALKKTVGEIASLVSGLLFAVVGVHFNHLFLSGDADGVFFLFGFLGLLFFFLSYYKSPKFLMFSGLSLALCFLTKSYHMGIFALVVLVVFIVFYKQSDIKIRKVGLYFLPPLVLPIGLWAVLRYRFDGIKFFHDMIVTDILSRATTELEGNARGLFYYFGELARALGGLLIVVLFSVAIFACILAFVRRDKISLFEKVLVLGSALIIVIPLLLYSLMTTKLSWYVWPTIIGFVFLTSWLCNNIYSFRKASKNSTFSDFGLVIVSFFILIGLVSLPNRRSMQYYYDASTLAPIKSFFYELPKAESETYISVNLNGDESLPPQSWMLQGIYLGYTCINGDINTPSKYVAVAFEDSAQLQTFLLQHGLEIYSTSDNMVFCHNNRV